MKILSEGFPVFPICRVSNNSEFFFVPYRFLALRREDLYDGDLLWPFYRKIGSGFRAVGFFPSKHSKILYPWGNKRRSSPWSLEKAFLPAKCRQNPLWLKGQNKAKINSGIRGCNFVILFDLPKGAVKRYAQIYLQTLAE